LSQGLEEGLTSLEEAQRLVLLSVRPVGTEWAGIINALGRTLAEDVHASEDLPRFDNSAMDGYAVVAQDTAGASAENPKSFRLVGEAAVGEGPELKVAPGSAVRVMTGTAIPEGADAVVMVEDTHAEGRLVLVTREVQPGENIRPAGEDVRAGELVLPKGTLIGPAEMGMLAAVDRHGVLVSRRPGVSVITTGDEVVDLMEPLKPGKVRNSNRYSLAGQVFSAGCELGTLLHARDDPALVRKAVESARQSDVIVIAGGISVGQHDYVGDVLAQLGKVAFRKVAIRPGKPTAFALVEGTPVFALPGNPAGAMVSFELLVRPALLAMLGRRRPNRAVASAILAEDFRHEPGRRDFARAVASPEAGRLVARPLPRQGSGLLKPMVEANCLLIVPEDVELLRAGDKAQIILLDPFLFC